MEKTTSDFRIPCFMFGADARLRPCAFMDIAQELAGKGAEQLHFSDNDLKPHKLVWILARMSVLYDRLPSRGENCTMETWHRGLDGLFFIRDYRMIDSSGSSIITSTSNWVIMDHDSRRLVRSESLGDIITPLPQCSEAAVTEPCPRLILPHGIDLQEAGSRRVMFSDIDYNGHVNNARYPVWAYDALIEIAKHPGEIKKIDINFNREALQGETVNFLHCQDGNSHYIEGRNDGRQIFICRMTF